MAVLPFASGDRILFLGDSITEAGRAADRHGIGSGYPAVIRGFLAVAMPDSPVTVLNRAVRAGQGDALARWTRDAKDLSPTHLSVMVGTRDIWSRPESCDDQGIDASAYEAGMRELLETFASSGTARFILMTPAFLDSDPQSRSSLLNDGCEAVIERFAREFAAVLVPSRRALRLAAEQGPSIDFWLPDGIHPSPSGHAVLAASWLESVAAFAPWP